MVTGSASYAGSTTIDSSTLSMGTNGFLPSGASGGNVIFTKTGTNTNPAPVLDLKSSTQTVNGLDDVAGVGRILSTTANVSTLSVGANDTSSTFNGSISSAVALRKIGSGTLALSGTNTYTGGTTVSAGTLLVNGSLTNSAVTILSGGTFGGSGSIGALVTVQSDGTLSPGKSPGQLFLSAIDLQAGSTTLMEVLGNGADAGVAGTDYDQIQVSTSGGLSYGGALDLNFGNATKFLDGTIFDLFVFSGLPVGHFTAVTSSGTGLYAGFDFSGTGGIWTSTIGDQLLSFSELTGRLSFTSSGGAVPEIDPAMGGSALSLVAGVLAMIEQRRRRAMFVA